MQIKFLLILINYMYQKISVVAVYVYPQWLYNNSMNKLKLISLLIKFDYLIYPALPKVYLPIANN